MSNVYLLLSSRITLAYLKFVEILYGTRYLKKHIVIGTKKSLYPLQATLKYVNQISIFVDSLSKKHINNILSSAL